MVEAGSLELMATLETSDFERGNRRVKQGLEDTEGKVQQNNIAFSRLGSTVGTIAKTFSGLGVAGVGALTALGLKSPVVADELANIKVSAFELGNTVGKELQPALTVFDELIQTINSGLQGGGGTVFGLVTEGIVSLPLGILRDANSLIEKFNGLTQDDNGETKEGRVDTSTGLSRTLESWRDEGLLGSIKNDVSELISGEEGTQGSRARQDALQSSTTPFLLPPAFTLPALLGQTFGKLFDENSRKITSLFGAD